MTTTLQLLPLLLLMLPWVILAADLGAYHEAVPGLVRGLDLDRGLVTARPAPEAVTREVDSLLEPPLDLGPPADAAAERRQGDGGRHQGTMRGLHGRYAASHVGRLHDMSAGVDARWRAHQASEVEDLRGTPLVGGGRIADVETLPQAEVSPSSEKHATPSTDDDNDFLREEGWKPNRPNSLDAVGDIKNATRQLTSGTDSKSSSGESASNDDDNDFLRSDKWETIRPQEEAVVGERTVDTNTVTTQGENGSSGNSDDDNDFLRGDSWETPKVKSRDDKASAPPVGQNGDDDFLRDETQDAVVHKPDGLGKNVDGNVVSAPGVTNADPKSSASPIGNNVDDDDFLRDETLETVLTKPAVTDVNTARSPTPDLNERNEKSANDSGGKSDDNNGSVRADDLEARPQPARGDSDVESVPSSAVAGSDDRAGNNVDDDDDLRDEPLEAAPPQSEPAVRGGRDADIDADDEDEPPNHGSQDSHQPDDHVRRDGEEDVGHSHRGGDYAEGGHERREEDRDSEEEEEGVEEGGAGEGRKGGEEDVAWTGRRPLDGSDWPKWAGGDGPHGSTPPRYSGGGFVGGLADGEKLPDEDRHQRQAPAAAHHQGGPWVQQWLARGGGGAAGGGGQAAEAAGAARAAAAEAARRAAHRSSFRRGWRGSGSRDTAHDESWGRRRVYNYGLGGGVAGGDRSADLVAGGGVFLWQPWRLWQDGMLYL